MRYLMEFRTAAHAKVFNVKHPGIIDPQPGVTAYTVDTEPPEFGPVTVTPVEPVPEG
jgi:hypothetical protein